MLVVIVRKNNENFQVEEDVNLPFEISTGYQYGDHDDDHFASSLR